MKSKFTPLSIVAILALIGLSFWLRREMSGDRRKDDPSSLVFHPATVVDRSHPGMVATPAGRRVMSPAEREAHRRDLRTRLVTLMTEAEQVGNKGQAEVAAGKANSALPRLNEILAELKPIAADSVFPDVQTAASNGVEAMKVGLMPGISQALRDAQGLPPP